MSNETIERKRQDLKEPRAPRRRDAAHAATAGSVFGSPLEPGDPPPVSARISMEPMVMPTPQPFEPVLGTAPPEKKSRSFAPAMFIGACVVVAGCGIAMSAMLMKRPHAPPAAAAIFVAPHDGHAAARRPEPAAAPLPTTPPAANSTSTCGGPPATPPATKPALPAKPLKGKLATTPASTTPTAQSPSSLDDLMRKAVGK